MSTSTLLWALQPPEGKPSFLFGTMHIRDERVYRFCDALYPFILHADVYVGEMDMEPPQEQFTSPVYALESFFRPSVYEKIRTQLTRSFGLDIARYAHLHPLMIMSAISQAILVNDHAVSLDEHLWDFAKRNNLELRGLETVHEQVTLLHSIPPEPLYVQIRKISKSPHKIRRFTAMALTCYTEGEIHRLYQLTRSSMHSLRKQIIYNRNRLMVRRIMDFPRDRSYFIAVGAGHLSGQSGLISLLRKEGWAVTALTS